MKKNKIESCELSAKVKVKDKWESSKLYNDLLNKLKSRPLTNYVYASYLQKGVAASMDKKGYKVNEQNQHSADDVISYLKVSDFVNGYYKTSNETIGRNLGIIDEDNNPIIFNNAEEAFEKAQQLNNTNNSKVAYVLQYGNGFIVKIEGKDSLTVSKLANFNTDWILWNELKSALKDANIDITKFYDFANDIVNPLNTLNFVKYLNNLKSVQNSDLSLKDIEILLTIGQNINSVKTLINRWNLPLEETATKIYDILQNPSSSTTSLNNFINNTLNEAKISNGFDANQFLYYIDTYVMPNKVNVDEAISIDTTLKKLNEQYGINKTVIVKTSKEINKLSEATTEAILVLQKQLRLLQDKEENNELVQELNDSLNSLITELESKRYLAGLTEFLTKATEFLLYAEDEYKKIPSTGTRIESIKARSEVYSKMIMLQDAYSNIVQFLSNLTLDKVDEAISEEDLNMLKSNALKVRKLLDAHRNIINTLSKDTMTDLLLEYLGERAYDGIAIAQLLHDKTNDSTLYDNLYSMSRVSNPFMAMLGGIIHDAQDDRDKKLNTTTRRIELANRNLKKAGFTSEFMYDDGYIISDIDWDGYYKAKHEAESFFKYKEHLKGTALRDAIDSWVAANNEDRIVDIKSGRTEKVPNANYRKAVNPLDNLHPAQLQYYNTMMQLKGELGTLLPKYAQKHYLPPQLRKSTLDLLKSAIKGDITAKSFVNILLDRMKVWEIKPDDIRFAKNGTVLEGQQYVKLLNNFDGTPLQRIPIFYINKIGNKDELLRDFSGAMQSFASTAINYEAMDNISSTVELISDFTSAADISHKKENIDTIDIVESKNIILAERTRKDAKFARTPEMLNSFIEQQMYGHKFKEDTPWNRIVSGLIGFTSFKSLTFNILGGTANYLVGEFQMMIEAGAGEFYNVADYIWAHKTLFGDKTIKAKDDIMNWITDTTSSKLNLLIEEFDPLQENYSNKSHKRYYNNLVEKIFGDFDSQILYGAGEYIIHIVNMYAFLHNQKVLKDDKQISLYDALESKLQEDRSYKLVPKEGVTQLNGKLIDDAFLKDIRKKVRYINQTTHGSMNSEDKGLIHQRILGRLAMNFKQWMVDHYSRRYRGIHYDASIGDLNQTNFYNKNKVIVDGKETSLFNAFSQVKNEDGSITLVLKPNVTTKNGEEVTEEYVAELAKRQAIDIKYRRGFWTELYKFLFDYKEGCKNMEIQTGKKWDSLNQTQKDNLKRVFTAMSIFSMLVGFGFVLGEPDDYDGNKLMRWLIWLNKKMKFEFLASSPFGIPWEVAKIKDNPIPALSTVANLTYPITGLIFGDAGEVLKSGPDKGMNKWWRNVKNYNIPGYKQIKQFINMDTEDDLFTIFDISNPLGQ